MANSESPDGANTSNEQHDGAAQSARSTGAPAQRDEDDAASLAQAFAALADEPTLPDVGAGQGTGQGATQTAQTTQAPEPLWPTESTTSTEAPENYPVLEATSRQQEARAVAPWLFPSSTPAYPDPLDATTQPAEFAPTEKAPTVAAPAAPPAHTPDISEQSTARLPQRPLEQGSHTPPASAQPRATTGKPAQIVPPSTYRSTTPAEQPTASTAPDEISSAAESEWPDLSTPLLAMPPLPAPELATPPPAQPRTTEAPVREQRQTSRYVPPDMQAQAQPYAPPRPSPRPTAPPQQPPIRRAPQQTRSVAPPEWSAHAAPIAPAEPVAPPVRPAPIPTLSAKQRGGFSFGGLMILLVVLAFLGVAGYGVYTTTQAERPYETAQVFCADLRSQSYSSAYMLLSSRYQATLSQRLFVLSNQLHDQLNGVINSCSVTSPSSVGFTYRAPTSVSVATVIVRNQTLRGALTLIQQGGSWRVDQIASTLEGTDVGPLLTQARFCDAVMVGNYALAYAQLATGAQAPGSEQDFALAYAHAFSGENGGLKLTQCQPDLTTYKVGATYGKVNVTFVTQGANQQITFPTVFTFALQNGVWKIASLTTSVTPTA